MKNQQQYTKDVFRTWKEPNLVKEEISLDRADIIASIGCNYEEVAHIIAGISSEILSELEFAFAVRDQTNIIEEIGDLQYYILVAAQNYGADLTNIDALSPLTFSDPKLAKFCLDSPFKSVKYHAGELINRIKKVEIYKDPRYDVSHIIESIQKLQVAVYRLSAKNGFTPSEAIEKVISKLKERFKEKFTVEEVSNRDLEAERKALDS